jgi:hypothetical protein
VRLVHKPEKEAKSRRLRLISCCIAFLIIGLYLGWKQVPGFIKANFIFINNSKTLSCLLEKNDLDTIYLDIPFKNLQQIEAKRNEALTKTFLITSDEDLVKANISTGHNQLPCKLRLKGDLADHWSGDKWSMRVEMKNDYLLKGMSKFSIQDPKTRTDTEEWLYLQTLRKEKCMHVRYEFVNLVLNGKPMGIYALEEHFSKEMIEYNKRREGVIVNFDDYFFWREGPYYGYDNIGSSYLSSPVKVRNKSRISKSEKLSRQKEHAFNLIRQLQNEELEPSNIFDIEIFGKFLAITHLWNAEHVFGLDDINFYFNPVTGLLEPIGFDAEPRTQKHKNFFTDGPKWVQYALKDDRFAKCYIKNLERVTHEDYLKQIKNEWHKNESNIRRLLTSEYFGKAPSTIWANEYKIFKYNPWGLLFSRAKTIRDSLNIERLVLSYARNIRDKKLLEITLRNATTLPIVLNDFKYRDNTFHSSEIISESSILTTLNIEEDFITIPPSNGKLQNNNYIFKIRYDDNETIKSTIGAPELIVEANFLGHSHPPIQQLIPIDEFKFNQNILPFKNNRLELDSINYKAEVNSSKTINVISGIYQLNKPVYIPKDYILNIEAGTSFIFSENSTLVCQGCIKASGTKEKPIKFTSFNKEWPGMLIYNSNLESDFSYVYFNNIAGIGKGLSENAIIRNGWTTTGGITAFKSMVKFSYCIFANSMSEDALNIISSRFSLEYCMFKNISSDAFDGDFVHGSVNNCIFSNINGDGVDFSGSQVSVNGCAFYNIKDKAISIGEASVVNVGSSKFNNVSFGVVAKDMSNVIVDNCKIEQARVAAFSAYQKKNSFGPAKMEVNDSKIIDSTNDFLLQNGSSILHESFEIESEDLNVEKLYDGN